MSPTNRTTRLSELYDAVLECSESGAWTWRANGRELCARPTLTVRDERLLEGEGEQSG